MADWGRNTATGIVNNAAITGVFRLLGGTPPNTQGNRLESASVYFGGTAQVGRLAVYQGGALNDPLNAELVEDLGILNITGTQFHTLPSVLRPRLRRLAPTWIAFKSQSGPVVWWWTSSAERGDFQAERGRVDITGGPSFDATLPFPAVLNSGTRTFASVWNPWYLSYTPGESVSRVEFRG